MRSFRVNIGWIGIILLGVAHGVLEDLMFIKVLVEYAPVSWDLTGQFFFVFTVPLAQLMTFAITGTLAWHFLDLHQIPRLITFWLTWVVARATFLAIAQNPVGDISIYLAWITLWCCLVGLYARSKSVAPAQD